MKRFSSSVYMFFKKLICSEMKPLDNYSTLKKLGYREYLMRCLFFLWSILWVDAVLLNNLSISWNMFWFCLKKNHFSLTRRSKIFFFGFCLTGPFYGDFTFAFGDIEIQKKKFHSSKRAMKNVYIYEILISDEFTLGKSWKKNGGKNSNNSLPIKIIRSLKPCVSWFRKWANM